MGMVINRAPIDSRLLKDNNFYQFFCDYYEKESNARMQKMIMEEHKIVLDDSFDFRAAMSDEEYVSKVYKEYKKGNA